MTAVEELSKWEQGTMKALGLEWSAWDALFRESDNEETKKYCVQRMERLHNSLLRLGVANKRRVAGLAARKRRGKTE